MTEDLETRKELARFAKDYLVWVGEVAPLESNFTPSSGLCFNLESWSLGSTVDIFELSSCLKGLLRLIYHNAAYPFGGELRFDEEGVERTAHTNPMRLAFCKYIADSGCNTKPVTDDFGNIVTVRSNYA